jgi:hypothetical protein
MMDHVSGRAVSHSRSSASNKYAEVTTVRGSWSFSRRDTSNFMNLINMSTSLTAGIISSGADAMSSGDQFNKSGGIVLLGRKYLTIDAK